MNQPREFDAVLGGKAPTPIDGVVLGGIEGVKHRFNNSNTDIKIAALSEAFNYGEVGLDVLNQALQSTSAFVRISAYSQLKSCSETWAKQAIKDLGSYELFKCDRIINLSSQSINSLALGLDSEMLICSKGENNRVNSEVTRNAWNYYKREQHLTFPSSHSSGSYRVAISPDGQRMMRASKDSKTIVWDVKTGKQVYDYKEHLNISLNLAFHLDNKVFLSHGDGRIRIWNLQTGQQIGILDQTFGGIEALGFTTNGKLLILGCMDYTIRFWDIERRLEIGRLKSPNRPFSLAISPDGQTLVSGGDQRIKIWD